MPEHSPEELSRAVLYTLAYADVFDYPLTAREIHTYLTGVRASFETVLEALLSGGLFTRSGEYFTLPGREGIVGVRRQREARSQELLPRALTYGRLLGALPFVRMVALTGSLAVRNIAEGSDFDYMLIAARGRVWTARAFALALNRLVRLRGDTLCPNLILSEDALEWPRRDLYSARELCQMIPIAGLDVYSRLMDANPWVQSFLPNCSREHGRTLAGEDPGGRIASLAAKLKPVFELPLRGRIGERFERWEMQRKIARFSRQPGFGEETVFNAHVCQGNFDQHGSRTRRAFEKRLQQYIVASEPRLSDGAVAAQSPHLP